jgi:hypothetical protein
LVRDPLADRPLASIRTMDIAGWQNERTQAGNAPTTIKNALRIISQVYQLAATEWGMEGCVTPSAGSRCREAGRRVSAASSRARKSAF